MGKALRLTRRSRSNSLHGLSTYPYAPKIVHPRGKPLQRTCVLACLSSWHAFATTVWTDILRSIVGTKRYPLPAWYESAAWHSFAEDAHNKPARCCPHRPCSASDLRRLFASVTVGQNGTGGSAGARADASFARRAAGSLERLIARHVACQ